jgi:hypothetical protein
VRPPVLIRLPQPHPTSVDLITSNCRVAPLGESDPVGANVSVMGPETECDSQSPRIVRAETTTC